MDLDFRSDFRSDFIEKRTKIKGFRGSSPCQLLGLDLAIIFQCVNSIFIGFHLSFDLQHVSFLSSFVMSSFGVMKNLRKFGYHSKSIRIKRNSKYNKLLIKAFQRRFRPELINSKIDQECLLIANKLANIKL